MRIVVQKFGGTSVATEESRSFVLAKVLKLKLEGFFPVVVVSAMGRSGENYATDTLIHLLKEVNDCVNARELDQIMCCGEMISAAVMTATLQKAGLNTVMLNGSQAGIITDSQFSKARIQRIDTTRIFQLINKGKIPVVCGFQGVNEFNDFTTLGRGGSDTTAAALGVALQAERIEIYTDVEGIMTADPRLVDNTKILDKVSYDEVCQLAYQGAKVIHPRAVEIAMQKHIPLLIKSTFSDVEGTLIGDFIDDDIHDRIVTGIAYLDGLSQVKVSNIIQSEQMNLFRLLGNGGISIDLINIYPDYIVFTIDSGATSQLLEILEMYSTNIEIISYCAKVSIVGGGMREASGVIASFVESLSKNNIKILQTVDSHTSISALIATSDLKNAITFLHDRFILEK